MSETKSTPSLESTLKSLDTEEFIDIHFYRPIGYQWALFFNKLGVSPNSITIASIFIGITAGICFYFQSLAINVIGMLPAVSTTVAVPFPLMMTRMGEPWRRSTSTITCRHWPQG